MSDEMQRTKENEDPRMSSRFLVWAPGQWHAYSIPDSVLVAGDIEVNKTYWLVLSHRQEKSTVRV